MDYNYYISPDLKASIDDIDKALDDINKACYSDVDYIANGVLSKNLYVNNLLFKYHKRELIEKRRLCLYIIDCFIYYSKSFVFVSLWLINKILFVFSGYKSENLKNNNLNVIDTFISKKNLLDNGKDNHYFKGIDTILKKNDIIFSYCPVLYDLRSPVDSYKVFKSARDNESDIIFEFELLKFSDMLKVVFHIFRYPIKIYLLSLKLKASNGEKHRIYDYISNELLLSVKDVTFISYVRYLTGYKLNENCNYLNLFSWGEGQSLHKLCYKGINESSNKSRIICAQLFVKYPQWISTNISINEITYKACPDLILCNGKLEFKSSSLVEKKLGLSLRYQHIFNDRLEITSNGNVILLLSYFEHVSKKIIDFSKDIFDIRPHPALKLQNVLGSTSERYRVHNGDLLSVLMKFDIIVSSCSGVIIEALCLGKSVILIEESGEVSSNPLINLGKGIIWDVVSNQSECQMVKERLSKVRNDNPSIIYDLAIEYRNLYFTEKNDDFITYFN